MPIPTDNNSELTADEIRDLTQMGVFSIYGARRLPAADLRAISELGKLTSLTSRTYVLIQFQSADMLDPKGRQAILDMPERKVDHLANLLQTLNRTAVAAPLDKETLTAVSQCHDIEGLSSIAENLISQGLLNKNVLIAASKHKDPRSFGSAFIAPIPEQDAIRTVSEHPAPRKPKARDRRASELHEDTVKQMNSQADSSTENKGHKPSERIAQATLFYLGSDGKISQLTESELLPKAVGDYILYDSEKRTYGLYRVEKDERSSHNRLLRFPLKLEEEAYKPTGDSFFYNATTKGFVQYPATMKQPNPPNSLSKEQVEYLEHFILLTRGGKYLSQDKLDEINKHLNPEAIKRRLEEPEGRLALINITDRTDLEISTLWAAFDALKKAGILDEELVGVLYLLGCSSGEMAFQKLKQAGIIDEEIMGVLRSDQKSESFEHALFILNQSKIELNEEYRETLSKHQWPISVARALVSLKKAEILSQENLEAVIKHPAPEDFAETLILLKQAEILSPENLEAVIKHPAPGDFGETLILLKQAEILSPENIASVSKCPKLYDLLRGLKILDEANILNEENFQKLCDHRTPSSLAGALARVCHDEERQDWNAPPLANYIESLFTHPEPHALAAALYKLHREKLLIDASGQENGEALCSCPSPWPLAVAIYMLHTDNLLNSANREAMREHPDPKSFAKALSFVHQKGWLSDKTRQLLKELKNPKSHGELLVILSVVIQLQNFISQDKTLQNTPRSQEKVEALVQYTIERIKDLDGSVRGIDDLKRELAQMVFNKARKIWGTEHPNARRILDALLILLSVAGIGLILIGAKKVATGHCFFHIGKDSERTIIKELEKSLDNKPRS